MVTRRYRRGDASGGVAQLAVGAAYVYLRPLGCWLVPIGLAVGLCAGLVLFHLYRRRRIRVQTLGEMLALTPSQFERAIGTLLHDRGYRNVKNIGRTGDQGIDLTCRDPNGRDCGVQCKRYAPGRNVGSPELRRFLGSLVYTELERGIYVTTSGFTAAAREVARQSKIELVDGERLTSLLIEQRKLSEPARLTASTP